MTIDQFANASSRGNSTVADTGSIGNALGVNWSRTTNLYTDTTLSTRTLTTAAITAGAKAFTISGVQSGDVIPAGTTVKFAGGSTTYTVAATVTASTTTAAVTTLEAMAATDASTAVTLGGEYNIVVGMPEAIAIACPAMFPLQGIESSVRSESGLSIRVSFSSSLSTLTTDVVFDLLMGAAVLNPEAILKMTLY